MGWTWMEEEEYFVLLVVFVIWIIKRAKEGSNG